MSMYTCWKLAQKWDRGRMGRVWIRPDKDGMQDLFNSLGLIGEFWDL